MKKNPFFNKDQENIQKQIFHLLYEYALRFMFRYTGPWSDTNHYVHEGFARLFKEWKYLNLSDINSIKPLLKEVLIKVCIETELNNSDLNVILMQYTFLNFKLSHELTLANVPPKQTIYAIKTLPFPLRLIYNLFVIDGYKEKEISEMLHIQHELIQRNIQIARQCLIQALAYNLELEKKRV